MASNAPTPPVLKNYSTDPKQTLTPQILLNTFTYHAPKGDQTERYSQIRQQGLLLAQIIVACCPPSADTTAAIRHVREAVMTANASIALGE